MKKIIITLLTILLISCGREVSSNTTICPCKIVAIDSLQQGFEITLQGYSIYSDGTTYRTYFSFFSKEKHSIGDIIK